MTFTLGGGAKAAKGGVVGAPPKLPGGGAGAPLNFVLSAPAAAPKPPKPAKPAKVRSEPRVETAEAASATTGVGKRSVPMPNYSHIANDAGNLLEERFKTVAAQPASVVAPQPLPPSSSSKPKKAIAAAARPAKSGGASGPPPPRQAPEVGKRFAVGPPYMSEDDYTTADLRPARPALADAARSGEGRDPAVYAARMELAQTLKDLGALDGVEVRISSDWTSIQKLVKSKLTKAQRHFSSKSRSRNRLNESGDEPRIKKRSGRKGDDDLYGGDYVDDGGLGSSSAALPRKPKKLKSTSSAQTKHLPPYLQSAVKLLDALIRMDEAFWFRLPVDRSVLPSYYTVILNPIDLGTIRKRCLTQHYGSIDEVSDDLDLMFNNCVTFNNPLSEVSAACRKLQAVWTKRIDAIRSDAAAGEGKAKAAAKPRMVKDMTFAEKEQLVGMIGELPPEQLANVVQIVAETMALEGGDKEGGEVVIDIAEMSNETLRKLQVFVHEYRRGAGLPVPTDGDEVQLAGEEDGTATPAAVAPAAGTAASAGTASPATAPKPKKRQKLASSSSSRKRDPTVKAAAPTTQDGLMELASQTKENTVKAIQELKDELRRMAGKVVDKDHQQEDGSLLASVAAEYSLDPEVLAKQLAAAQENDSDDVSSDTVSSSEEDEDEHEGGGGGGTGAKAEFGSVHILPTDAEQAADVVIENAAGWQLEEGREDGGASGGAGGGGSGGEDADEAGGGVAEAAWEQFAGQDAQQAEQAKARKEHEEKLKRELQEREEELRRQEKEKRTKKEEEERRRKEEKEQEEREAMRAREEERLARKREREEEAADAAKIDLSEQQRIMQEFQFK